MLDPRGAGVEVTAFDSGNIEMEGLVKVGDTIYQCKNRYYHQSVANGNEVWAIPVL